MRSLQHLSALLCCLAVSCVSAERPQREWVAQPPTVNAEDPAPPEPVAAPTEVLPTSRWVSGEPAATLAGCDEANTAVGRERCRFATKNWRFEEPGLKACRPLVATGSSEASACLSIVAEQSIAPLEAEICGSLAKASDRTRCLDAVVGRELAQSDVERCRDARGANRTIRCLKRAYEYVFDVEALRRTANAAVAEATRVEAGDAKVRAALGTINASLGDGLAPPDRSEHKEFLLNFAGGAIGHYKMLYCSRHEYLILFGTPLATAGYSGQYRFAVHDWLLTGKMRTQREGELTTSTFEPGGWAKLPPGTSKVYTTVDGTYMLEYARGPIINAYKFGITVPARTMSVNRENRRNQIRSCSRSVFRNEANARRQARGRAQARKRLQREIMAQLASI